MRLDKPTGTWARQELPMFFLCGDEIILCGSELFTCGGGYIIPKVSEVVGVSSRESEPTDGAGRLAKPTGTWERQNEVT